MKSAGKARSNGLYRHIRTSKEIIRNLLNDSTKHMIPTLNIALAAPARHIERVCAGAAVAFELRIRRISAALRGADHFATRTSCKSKIAALWVNPSTLALTPTCA